MKIKESLNVTFDETPPPSKTSPLVDDDLDKEEAIKIIEKKNLENDIEDETLEIDEVVNIMEYRNHPLENVIGNFNQRTLSYAVTGSILINRGLIQAILTSLPPQPIGEATKASNLQRILLGVQGRSHFIYFLYLIIFLDYRVTMGFGSTGGLDLACPIIRLSRVDVDTLTMEQYLALSREKQAPAVVKPKIGGNVNFEIKSQFMREMREDIFSGNKNEDAHDHIDRVLSIVSLFNILGVYKDAVML
ncbi:hypothetical protein Tco_1109616 [Tanacetum coccineum]